MTIARTPISFVATSVPEKAKTFYRDVMGLALQEETPFALVFADGPGTLRVQITGAFSPASHTVHGWQVADIEQEIAELAMAGVNCLDFPHLSQSTTGVWTTPDGNKVVWFKDPDDNILSFTQFKTG